MRLHLKPIPVILYSFSLILVAFSIVFIYSVAAPVDVLKDWKIIVPQKEYTAGSVVYLESSYNKVKKISGDATRYLQCKKPTGEWDGYILLSTANANRPQATTSSAITALALPVNVANLPNTCRIYINVDYKVNSFRNFTEQNYSNEFRLVPSAQSVLPTQSSQAPAQVGGTTVTTVTPNGDSRQFIQPDNTSPASTSTTVTNNIIQPQDTGNILDIITSPVTTVTDTLKQLFRR